MTGRKLPERRPRHQGRVVTQRVRVPEHIIAERRRSLARLLAEKRYLPVRKICSLLGVSESTARRDLAALEKERVVTRTYGGAITEFDERFPSFAERELKAAAAKLVIAQKAAALAHPGETIYFDVGTTVNAIAREIARNCPRPLRAVTCSLPAAETLSQAEGVEVHMTGGQLVPRQSALFGAAAREALQKWHFNRAFVSAEGFDHQGVWNTSADLVALQRLMLSCSEIIHVCADASKAGRRAAALLFTWQEADDLISDLTSQEAAKLGFRVSLR